MRADTEQQRGVPIFVFFCKHPRPLLIFIKKLRLRMAVASTMRSAQLLLVVFAVSADARNSLARTPPMGWMSWELFRCDSDCKKDPHMCISEQLYKAQTDGLADGGFIAAGYTGIHMDDCWEQRKPPRDPKTGELRPEPTRFPRSHISSSCLPVVLIPKPL